MMSHSKNYPIRVKVKHNKTMGCVVIDKIRTIDKKRVTKIVDKLSEKVNSIIQQTFVL